MVVVLIFLAAPLVGAAAPATQEELAEMTAVIYSTRNASSEILARHYIEARSIPAENVIGLDVPDKEIISRKEFNEAIARPLRQEMIGRGFWVLRDDGHVIKTKIRFVALIYGIPLKIKGELKPEKGQSPVAVRDEASVDQEIAALAAADFQPAGALNNPYFRSFKPIAEANMPLVMLVCRLDAPNPQTVKRMIDDALIVENKKGRLYGWAMVKKHKFRKHEPLFEGEEMLDRTAKRLFEAGFPTWKSGAGWVQPEKGWPVGDDLALYFAWYTGHAFGVFRDPAFRFKQGAVAVHLHSFSAATLRPSSSQPHWVGPLLERGAAASLGNVWEPYLGLTHKFDIFIDRLLSGFTFAEAAYMSMPALSWMAIAAGDPLYRPFPIRDFLDEIDPPAEDEAFAKAEPLLQDYFQEPSGENHRKIQAAIDNERNAVLAEFAGLLLHQKGKWAAGDQWIDQSAKIYENPTDLARIMSQQILISIHRRGRGYIEDLYARAQKQLAGHPYQKKILEYCEAKLKN